MQASEMATVYESWQLQLPPLLCECVAFEKSRYQISKPFRIGDHVYTTNGRMAARCPLAAMGNIEVEWPEKSPPADEVFATRLGKGLGHAIHIPYIPLIKERIWVGRSGYDRDEESYYFDFKDFTVVFTVGGFSVGFAGEYLRQFFPFNPTMYVVSPSDPAYFRVGDAEALLMPKNIQPDRPVSDVHISAADLEQRINH